LQNKYYLWVNENRPLIITDDRGLCNKSFTDSEELQLFNYIKITYIDKRLPLCNEDIKLIAIEKWKYLHSDQINSFSASTGWCANFKKRWCLVIVKPRFYKQPVHVCSLDEIRLFEEQCLYCMDLVGYNNFFNMDEIFWRMINFPLTTIKIKGEPSGRIRYYGNEKDGFTVVLIISASGKIFKPMIIAKGKTEKCIEKLNLNKKVIGCFSNNGWMNRGIMKIVLDQIYLSTSRKLSVLLLDQHPSHTGDFIEKEAKDKNIKLIYVPAGMTPTCQPLDIKINGILKSHARKLWRKKQIKYPQNKPHISDAVVHLLSAYNCININIIKKAFY